MSSSNEAKVLAGTGVKESRTGPASAKPKTTTAADSSARPNS
ncbi:hypothetical protein [Kitasatospora sp. NPDC101183]